MPPKDIVFRFKRQRPQTLDLRVVEVGFIAWGQRHKKKPFGSSRRCWDWLRLSDSILVQILEEIATKFASPRFLALTFRFIFGIPRWGRQGDTCYVRCPTPEAVDRCVQEIQESYWGVHGIGRSLMGITGNPEELAVPKRAAHGSLFGSRLRLVYGSFCGFCGDETSGIFLVNVNAHTWSGDDWYRDDEDHLESDSLS